VIWLMELASNLLIVPPIMCVYVRQCSNLKHCLMEINFYCCIPFPFGDSSLKSTCGVFSTVGYMSLIWLEKVNARTNRYFIRIILLN